MSWADDAVFYHVYPLGLCGAPEMNDFSSPPVPRLEKLLGWVEHIRGLGADALYLGPVFESSTHGYDTADYRRVDRRLGTNQTLSRVCEALHGAGMRVILDGVFNHVGRDFPAFKDVREKGEASAYADWFRGLTFGGRSPCGDPFTYEGWNGHHSLVKLDVTNPAVREHLLCAVNSWVSEYSIDGLRLDAADVIDRAFLRELAGHCRGLRPDFWLVGEVVHGDYRKWAGPGMLDSVTNYECYKGLYSSHVDGNYFEIAYALKRQFGPAGIYAGLPLYAFADNHDVDRVASRLADPDHLAPLYTILFTMPGVPSVYYGSEWGIPGKRAPGTDRDLRPCLELEAAARAAPAPGLPGLISRLAAARRSRPALRSSAYTELHVSHRQMAYLRGGPPDGVIVTVNSAREPAHLALRLPGFEDGTLHDLLEPGAAFRLSGTAARVEVPACGGRVLAPKA
jgi:cyclomaltodextrinase / maltogenic alpha-amylase / neopullulanase